MAVIFGEKQKDGWLKVTMIQWQQDKHPNGHSIKADKIPEYPSRKPGVGYVQMFNPKTKKFRYDEISVPLTQEEALQEVAAAIRELTEEVKSVKAVLGSSAPAAKSTSSKKTIKKAAKKTTKKKK